jgi:signal transduction histidine kinase
MVRQRASIWVNLLQYSMLLLFGAQALIDAQLFSARWWAILTLVVLLAALNQFWPKRRGYNYAYLLAMGGLIFALTLLDSNFMYMVYQFSVIAVLLLPVRTAFLVIGGLCLALVGILISQYGLEDVLFSGLILISGSYAFGYAFHMQERAEEQREKAQQLLDELRAAHERLEAYARQAQELAAVEERNRLGRELHDSVKQQAFAVSGQLGAARALLNTSPEDAQVHLLKAEALMDEVRLELGQIIQALRPAVLQGHGLEDALRSWGAGWSEQSGITLKIRADGLGGLPPEIEQALLRVAQEALSNTARHSRASHADVLLWRENNHVRLIIQDDGEGFDPVYPPPGVGLTSMRERAEQLPDGSFTIESSPGMGTRITACCEWSAPAAVNQEQP